MVVLFIFVSSRAHLNESEVELIAGRHVGEKLHLSAGCYYLLSFYNLQPRLRL